MKIGFSIYLITDRKQTKGRVLTTVIEKALAGGVSAVQLREKDLSAKELFETAIALRKITEEYGAKLFINDRADIAMAVRADGVHLGRSSFRPVDVRRIFPEAIIGSSAHSLTEAKTAETEGADFITIGPVFETPLKAGFGRPLGIEVIKTIKQTLNIPVFAIGGIKKENIRSAMDAGADGAALISGIISADEPETAAREIGKIAAIK